MTARMSYDEFRLLPDDGRRLEVIDGVQYVQATPNTKHQSVSGDLALAIDRYLRGHRCGEIFIARLDVVLSYYDIVEPDLIFVSETRKHIITEANIQGAPDLLIEILSASNREYDEVLKFRRYEALGVGEYWTVDPDNESVKIYRRTTPGFALAPAADELTTPLLPGFALPVRTIFEP